MRVSLFLLVYHSVPSIQYNELNGMVYSFSVN